MGISTYRWSSRATSSPRDRRSASWDRPAIVPDRSCISRCASQACRSTPCRYWASKEVVASWIRPFPGGTFRLQRRWQMVNRVILVGRLTRDPEIVVSPKGLTIAKLRLATNSFSKDDAGNRQEEVQYHSLVAFDRLAGICQEFLTRGKLIYAEGRLRSHEWDGKDGLRRYTTEVVIDQMKMLSPKTESTLENVQPIGEPVPAA